jgi:hypothetical protein
MIPKSGNRFSDEIMLSAKSWSVMLIPLESSRSRFRLAAFLKPASSSLAPAPHMAACHGAGFPRAMAGCGCAPDASMPGEGAIARKLRLMADF